MASSVNITKEGGRMRSILEPKPKLRFTHSILKIRLVLISFPSSNINKYIRLPLNGSKNS